MLGFGLFVFCGGFLFESEQERGVIFSAGALIVIFGLLWGVLKIANKYKALTTAIVCFVVWRLANYSLGNLNKDYGQ